jgi:death-on-curing protein
VTAEPEWVALEDALLIHGQLIAVFGGAAGVREEGLLESALTRPRDVFAYDSEDLAVLAAAYAHSIVKNHPFVDGNKRVAFVVARILLGLNNIRFNPPEAEAVVMVEGLAGGQVTQDEFAAWVGKHSK